MQVNNQVHVRRRPDIAMQDGRDAADDNIPNLGLVEQLKDRNEI